MIDWKRVTSMREEVGEHEFRPLVELFLDEIEDAIMGVAPSDRVALRHALHFMKGCALNMGLTGFCLVCDGWERALTDEHATFPHIDALKDSYSASKQVLMRDLDRMTLAPSAQFGAA